MKNTLRGFTLIELVTVMILVGILSITLFTRLGSAGTAAIQSGRDDLIAALLKNGEKEKKKKVQKQHKKS